MEDKHPMIGSEEVHSCGEGGTCAACEERAKHDKEHEEVSLAFLLALLPAITLTLFGNMGLL